jgi:intraflagellar transport protein 122
MLSPFKSAHPATLFNCARFLLMRTLSRPAPLGVSMVNVIVTLARHAMDLGAYKLARFAYSKLQVRFVFIKSQLNQVRINQVS